MNKRKNLWILFSLIFVFFFVGCSDFYQDMSGSSIEMSFKVPEKIDERSLDSRSDTETDILTYKLIVKLESKNEVLDKIEKNVCSGELVNLAFTNVKKGKTVKVSAQLFQDGKSVYFGESDWINTTKGKNYAKVVLEKDYRPLVPEITLQPSDEIHFMLNENENDVLSIPFIVTAKIEYEQNLSVQLQEKTEKGWINFEYTFDEKSKIPYENTLMIMPTININIGESKVLRAAFTNSVTTETGKINSVTVYSNEVTLAYVTIDDYSLKHDRGYVIYGEEINKDDFELFANYTLNGNEKSAPVTIKNVTFGENSIGNVPFTFEFVVPYAGDTKLTTTISVPVKYQLNADKLAITAIVKSDENTQEINSESGLNIAQYTQNVQLSANYEDTLYLYTEGTDKPQPINILVNWASYSGGPSIGISNTLTIQAESNALSQGLATYVCTITPEADSDFIVGESVTKEYFVNVCPWKIKLKYYGVATSDEVDNQNLEAGKTYSPKLTNEAMEDEAISIDVTYSVTGKDYTINDLNVIQAPRASTTDQNATIKASWNGKEIASLEVVVPAEENSGTTGGGTSTYQIGDVYSKNIVIDNTAINNTTEIVVAANEITVSGNDEYWNTYYDSSAESFDDCLKGAFSSDKGSVLIQPFAISSYEVTQELFYAVMGFNPSYYGDSAPDGGWEGDPYTPNLKRPVEYITWYDAVNFCNELTKKTLGEEYCYYNISNINKSENNIISATITINTGSKGYRLPTEAEWEFAARGGDPNAETWYYAFPGVEYEDKIKNENNVELESLSPYAYYECKNEGLTSAVGEKKSNSLGLYDMAGNVSEWCWDEYDGEEYEMAANRGGSYLDNPYWCTVSACYPIEKSRIDFLVGFRICRSL